MQINDTLNLVVPVRTETTEGEDTPRIKVRGYHTPISREVFEANYRVLAATKAYLYSKGAPFLLGSGPRIAALTLKDEGRKEAVQRGDLDKEGKPLDGGVQALLLEIKRLTLILSPTSTGWEAIPVDTALQHGTIDEDDWREAESALVFFTCQCAMATKAEKASITQATASLLGAVCTSSSPMEYASSSLTSTNVETTAKKPVSSLPS